MGGIPSFDATSPSSDFSIRKIGMKEVLFHNDKPVGRRQPNTTKWEPYESLDTVLKTPESPTHLFVVRHAQASGQHHWALYVTNEDDPRNPGILYQVTGDHTYMVPSHGTGVDFFNDIDFADHWDLGPANQELIDQIRATVDTVPPPRAATQAEVRGTCQTWVMEVVRKLAIAGLVDERWIEQLEALRN